MRSLIIGGGQLGSALKRALGENASIANEINWNDPQLAQRQIGAVAQSFIKSSRGQRWLVCWSAGVGVVGAPEVLLAKERVALKALMTALETAPGFNPANGSFFLASSAGGIYASGSAELITEHFPPFPISDYGRSKLMQDEMVTKWAEHHGVRTLVGRVSNLYGPRQNLGKPQGFISHLCRAMAHRTTFTLTVPATTIRDFVFTDDVANRVALWAAGWLDPDGKEPQIKLLVAGRSVTLGNVIAMTMAISRTPARVSIASRIGLNEQPAALRFRSCLMTEMDVQSPSRSLEEGIAATWQSALQSLCKGL